MVQKVKFTQGTTIHGRYTTAERDSKLNPRAGAVILNTTTGRMEFYDGSIWKAFDGAVAMTEWLPTSVDKTFFIAPRRMIVTGIVARVDVVGTDAGAATAQIRKVASGTAITSGVLVHTGTINLKGTVNTNQTLTLTGTAADLVLAAGDALAIDFTGVLTTANGCVAVDLIPSS